MVVVEDQEVKRAKEEKSRKYGKQKLSSANDNGRLGALRGLKGRVFDTLQGGNRIVRFRAEMGQKWVKKSKKCKK